MTVNEPRWDERVAGSAFISHWVMTGADITKLASTRRLTLWNVRFPSDFRFSDLPDLEFLDIRGGSRSNLSYLEGCRTLQGLVVNQVRGLTDISVVSDLSGLRILSLYGLAKVEKLPDLSSLVRLERLDLGQMRNLTDWHALTTPPQLRELFFHNLLQPDPAVIDQLAAHPTLREFDWSAPDVPMKDPIRQRLADLAKTRPVLPEKWLSDARDS